MPSEAEIACKKIFVIRCLYAILLSISLQYVLLGVFLLFVNFNIFHPISWITGTMRLIFSFYTWICITPLISIIIIHGMFLGNSYLSHRKYFPTRFSYIRGTIVRKLISFSLHLIIGFLTAWLYTRFLNEEYRELLIKCFEEYCVNSRYLFLSLNGIYTGTYYFMKEHLRKEPELKFPIIQQNKYILVRSNLFSTLLESLRYSLLPTLGFIILFWLFGSIIGGAVGSTIGVQTDPDSVSIYGLLTGFKQLFFAWILSSQILCNMNLMEKLFNILLTEELKFNVGKNPMLNTSSINEITIVEALSLMNLPLAQSLASLDLFNLSTSNNSKRRQEIFSLSIPGGHPHNWNQLCGQILSMLNSFTEELSNSLEKIPIIKSKLLSQVKPTATEEAEKILLRQYNQTYGIRNLLNEQNFPAVQNQSTVSSQNQMTRSFNPIRRIHEICEELNEIIKNLFKVIFHNTPGLFYLFGHQEGTKTRFLLERSENIIWLSQALAGLCVSSLHEDRYGVVQIEINSIIKTLLKMKSELDRINNLNVNGKRIDKDCIPLKNAIKRSLYKICTIFSEYIKDIVNDPEDVRMLQCYANYQEM